MLWVYFFCNYLGCISTFTRLKAYVLFITAISLTGFPVLLLSIVVINFIQSSLLSQYTAQNRTNQTDLSNGTYLRLNNIFRRCRSIFHWTRKFQYFENKIESASSHIESSCCLLEAYEVHHLSATSITSNS